MSRNLGSITFSSQIKFGQSACCKIHILSPFDVNKSDIHNTGYDHLEETKTTFEEAAVLVAFTKAVIEMEYRLMPN